LAGKSTPKAVKKSQQSQSGLRPRPDATRICWFAPLDTNFPEKQGNAAQTKKKLSFFLLTGMAGIGQNPLYGH